MHYHVCFRMGASFAHLKLVNTLSDQHGLKGHMSYPRKGWIGMVRYVLQDSAVKLPVHMDPTPLFWPGRMTKEQMLEKLQLNEQEGMKKRIQDNKTDTKEEKKTGSGSWRESHKKREKC